jgi:hypothetical protein
MTQRVIRRVTTKIEEEILADDGQDQRGELEARLAGDGRHAKDEDGDVVVVTRRGTRAGHENLALPPMSRTRARAGRVHDAEDYGAAAQARPEDDGGHGDDSVDVVEAPRGSARAGRKKPAQPPISSPRGRGDR